MPRPLQFKNGISHDISLREKLVEEPEHGKIKLEYEDIPEFEILVYSLDEILVEKVRTNFQRGKARDYYDVWRLMKEKNFKTMQVKNCSLRNAGLLGLNSIPV